MPLLFGSGGGRKSESHGLGWMLPMSSSEAEAFRERARAYALSRGGDEDRGWVSLTEDSPLGEMELRTLPGSRLRVEISFPGGLRYELYSEPPMARAYAVARGARPFGAEELAALDGVLASIVRTDMPGHSSVLEDE